MSSTISFDKVYSILKSIKQPGDEGYETIEWLLDEFKLYEDGVK